MPLRAVRLPLLLAAATVSAAVALNGCSIGGGQSAAKPSGTKTASASASASATPKAASGKGGCPAGTEENITKVLDASTQASVGTATDLAFPGAAPELAKACIIKIHAAQGDSVVAIVPGDADLAARFGTAIEGAGFSAVTKDDTSAFYSKEKESWIVAKGGATNPVAAGLGSAFAGPTVTLAHAVLP